MSTPELAGHLGGSILSILGAAASAFFVSIGAIWLTRRFAVRHRLLDLPNPRSSHKEPVPRLGGIGVALGFICGAAASAMLGVRPDTGLLVCFSLVALLGLIDDLKPVPAGARLAGQLAVAAGYCVIEAPLRVMAVPGFGVMHLNLLAYPVSVLWITWMINLFNFMDGLDGVAGAQAVIAAVVFAITAAIIRDWQLAVLASAIGAAAIAFLLFNFPPASIFMGDAGSTALGFSFAAFALHASDTSPSSLAFPAAVLAVGPFLFDATFTVLRRMLARQAFWRAHRSHLYQRPQNWGVGHRAVLLSAVGLMLLSGGLALAYQVLCSSWVRILILVFALAVGGAVAWAVLAREGHVRNELTGDGT